MRRVGDGAFNSGPRRVGAKSSGLTELGAGAAVPLGLIRTWAEENRDHVAALNPELVGLTARRF
ncbi:hypothetical protein [Mycolicibacterium stellerae]|uniref:hypothetical protein n=1 Tax=Mycolicibacterium stellerae TaxID=2358193 RepID=UPI000F0B16CF|nr:hypothetical protein [Mycolicibacterium stellerae]